MPLFECDIPYPPDQDDQVIHVIVEYLCDERYGPFIQDIVLASAQPLTAGERSQVLSIAEKLWEDYLKEGAEYAH